jgi:adenine-specific DNA methylase
MRFPSVPVSRLALCEANCKKPVYTMHKWWARRLGVVFRMLLLGEGLRDTPSRAERWSRFYSSYQLPKDFTVLDPFLGGGTSLVEAAKLDANCIGVDIDPVACFVTEQELRGADPSKIHDAYTAIRRMVGNKISSLYRSKVGNASVDVIYYFWVDVISCPGCGERHDGHPTFQVAHAAAEGRQTVVCPRCNAIKSINLIFQSFTCDCCQARIQLDAVPVKLGSFTCPTCQEAAKLHELYVSGRVKPRIFAKEYLTKNGERGFAAVSQSDIALYDAACRKLWSKRDDLPIPDSRIPSSGRVDRRPLLYGYTRYHELFNNRQLYCLGLIAKELRKITDIDVKMSLALAFSHCLASNNMFCGYAFGYRRLTPLFSVHAFRKISRPVEGNVLGLAIGRGSFANCVRGVIEGCEYMRQPYELRYGRRGDPRKIRVAIDAKGDQRQKAARRQVTILNQSSERLASLRDQSVDLILSDPPYFNNLPYSELSDFYHVWLRKILGKAYVGRQSAHTPLDGSLFAGRRRGEPESKDTIKAYTDTLMAVFRECGRVAKLNARFIFTFHHRESLAWSALGTALLKSSFRVLRVFPVRSEGRSGLHTYSGSIKWDSIFICERRTRGEPRDPRKNSLAGCVTRAWWESGRWQAGIRQAEMDFGWADRGSLAMSLALCWFCRRNWAASSLDNALGIIDERIERQRARELKTSDVVMDGERDDATTE